MNIDRISNFVNEISPNTELNADNTKIFMQILLSNNKALKLTWDEIKDDENFNDLKPVINSFLVAIFLGRLNKMTTLKISVECIIFMSLILETPGQSVMYAYYLMKKLPENTFIDSDVLFRDIFPWGFISTEDLNKFWDIQKVKADDDVSKLTCVGAHDNLLDYVEVWK